MGWLDDAGGQNESAQEVRCMQWGTLVKQPVRRMASGLFKLGRPKERSNSPCAPREPHAIQQDLYNEFESA